MKKTFLLFLFFISLIVSAQSASEINTFIGIPDSLEYTNEVRVYKRYEITYSTEVFRIYNDGKEYKAELYHFHNDTKKFEKTPLKGSLGNERAWMGISVSGIEHLPQWKMLEYKFKKPEIVFYEGCYAYQTTSIAITDGVSYNVFYKSGMAENHIEYGNPESYLERFPGIDELEMFSQMLNTIRKEFGIWKNER